MKKELKRTQLDPEYAKANRICMKRFSFIQSLALKWLKRNHPNVVRAIREEAYRKYPVPQKRQESEQRYDYLSTITP